MNKLKIILCSDGEVNCKTDKESVIDALEEWIGKIKALGVLFEDFNVKIKTVLLIDKCGFIIDEIQDFDDFKEDYRGFLEKMIIGE